MEGNYIDTSSLDVYVAITHRRKNGTAHWMLMLAHPGSDRCTWYHVVGGPSRNTAYKCKIQANKKLDSFGIDTRHWVSRVPASEINKVNSTVLSTPEQGCQQFVTEIFDGLERKVLVPAGTGLKWKSKIEPSPYV